MFYLTHLKNKNEIFENLGDADIVIMACMGGILGFKYSFLTLFLASLISLPFFLKIKGRELAMLPFLNTAFVAVLFYKNLGYFYEA